MQTFQEILNRETIFLNADALSPHYIPDTLPHREKQIEQIMLIISSALKGIRPQNIFLYGKTGTGKTSTVRYVMQEFQKVSSTCRMIYTNCRIHNSLYKVMHKTMKELDPELEKLGFGLSFFYERLIERLSSESLIVVLDEIDMVKDLDQLIYTFIRANDEVKKGFVSIIGISNNLSFKDKLDTRSKSSLSEIEIVFPPYNASQLQDILWQRIKIALKPNSVDTGAVNLAAAITAQESGDARHALKLMLRAAMIADSRNEKVVHESDIEEVRRVVEDETINEVIKSLPEHQKIVLLAIALLTIQEKKQLRLSIPNEDPDSALLLSGEVYERYVLLCKEMKKRFRSARWYREYINELEMLGLITVTETGKGIRGHSRFIKIGYRPDKVINMLSRAENDAG